jgi:glyoxylase-like metal-dependent hydrolase (beta-lactamase superfamily II)
MRPGLAALQRDSLSHRLQTKGQPVTIARRFTTRGLVVACTLGLLSACASTPQPATEVLARAATAMGSSQLRTLRYSGEGIGYTFGQAYAPGTAWPKINMHSITRSIDYEAAAFHDDIVLSRAEPLGGGGYPLSGQQRNNQFIVGDIAWNTVGPLVVPGPRFVADRIHQLWITPHGVLKAAAANGATARMHADGSATVSFTVPGRLSASVSIGADGLVNQVDSVAPDPVLGDTKTVTTYGAYRTFGGIRFPTQVRQSMGGFPVLDVSIKDVQANVQVSLPVPDLARNQGERVAAQKVAEGVWFLAGGSHNSVMIEQKDHLIVVEAPLGDARTKAVLDEAKKLAPGKPIHFVVNSHPHFDHTGGLRAAAAEGATLVVAAPGVPYLERAFANPNAIRPDLFAQSGRTATFSAAGERLDIGDASRPVVVHRFVGGPHSNAFQMVYLPNEKLLIQADAYTPGAPDSKPTPHANNLSLVDNIERLELPVDRILPLHGRVVPLSELYRTAGRTMPR